MISWQLWQLADFWLEVIYRTATDFSEVIRPMKQIPNPYWKENYELEPSALQKAWIQLWFELLDPNTGYPYSPPLTTVVGLLDEWVNGREKGLRTRFFLLQELNALFSKDPALKNDASASKHAETVSQLTQIADQVFEWNGCRKSYADETLLKQSVEQFYVVAEELLALLQNDRHYRESLCRELSDRLTKSNANNNFATFQEVYILTGNLITELLSESQYSSSFLRAYCVETFLRQGGKKPFSVRLQSFLLTFMTAEWRNYRVYMRVQAQKIVEHTQKLGEIQFETAISGIFDTLELASDRQGWSNEQEDHAKRFFYYGKAPGHMVFAVIDNIEAEDPDRAAILALNSLDRALRQARFEYEARYFNVDKRLYVQDQQSSNFTFVSSRKLRRERHGTLGNPLRLERFMEWIERVQENYIQQEDSNDVLHQIATKATTTALTWHQDALNSDIAESQFMNHWISLEQIFEPLNQNVDCKSSAADKTAQAITEVLHNQRKVQVVQDLWGDLLRLGALGGRRLITPRDGRIEYSPALNQKESLDRYPYVPDDDYSRPEIYLHANGQRLTFKLPSGSIVLVRTGREVKAGQWLAGPRLATQTFTPTIQELFDSERPLVTNLFYLLQYQHILSSTDIFPDSSAMDMKPWQSYQLGTLIEALRWYDNLERLLLFAPPPYRCEAKWRLVSCVRDFLDNAEEMQEKSIARRSRIIEDRLLEASRIASDMEPFYDLYEQLWVQGDLLLESGEALSDLVLFEIYRDSPISVEKKISVFIDGDAKLPTDQPLLEYRLQSVALGEWPDHNLMAELDRMRRIRNEIFHEARAPKHINLIANRLYKYARIYLREVIHNMAFTFDDDLDQGNPESLLFDRS